jgi:nucleotide-binding universal stress UspA family protein
MSTQPLAPIVVGVDGSPSGLAAVPAAAVEALLHARPLRIVHAFNGPDQPERPDRRPHDGAEEILNRAADQARRSFPSVLVTTHLIEGPAIQVLLRQSRSAALLALGGGKLSSQQCLPVDADVVQIAARADCVVLIARDAQTTGETVAVGTDGSPSADLAVEFAFDAAARRAAALVVVRAWDTPGPAPAAHDLTETLEPWERKYAVRARAQVRRGDPGEVLLREAHTAGLLVIAARGQRPHRALLGSTAQRLLHRCPSPLVIVHGSTNDPCHGG